MELYMHGGAVATIYQGDSLELMPQMPGGSVDLVLADLPYGTTDCHGDDMLPPERLWECYRHVLRPGGAVVLFASQPFTSIMVCSNLAWFKYALVWDKNKCGSPGLAKVRPMKVHEDVLVFSPEELAEDVLVFAPGRTVYNPQMEKGEPYARRSSKPEGYVGKVNRHGYGLKPRAEFQNEGTRYPKSILRFPRDFSAQQQVHPHQKPVPLCRYLVETFSHPGQVVLDNTMGSGSGVLASLEAGRNVIGMEKYPEPYETARGRLLAFCGGGA